MKTILMAILLAGSVFGATTMKTKVDCDIKDITGLHSYVKANPGSAAIIFLQAKLETCDRNGISTLEIEKIRKEVSQ